MIPGGQLAPWWMFSWKNSNTPQRPQCRRQDISGSWLNSVLSADIARNDYARDDSEHAGNDDCFHFFDPMSNHRTNPLMNVKLYFLGETSNGTTCLSFAFSYNAA